MAFWEIVWLLVKIMLAIPVALLVIASVGYLLWGAGIVAWEIASKFYNFPPHPFYWHRLPAAFRAFWNGFQHGFRHR